MPNINKGDLKMDERGLIVAMAYADRYVMCRRPYCMPFVLSIREWEALPSAELKGCNADG